MRRNLCGHSSFTEIPPEFTNKNGILIRTDQSVSFCKNLNDVRVIFKVFPNVDIHTTLYYRYLLNNNHCNCWLIYYSYLRLNFVVLSIPVFIFKLQYLVKYIGPTYTYLDMIFNFTMIFRIFINSPSGFNTNPFWINVWIVVTDVSIYIICSHLFYYLLLLL